MDQPFVHYEILGPRSTLEHWLQSVQDLGSCHVADALRGLEGEAGIGRPAPTLEEWEAELVRSEAALALRGVERVLPSTARAPGARPSWHLEPGGVGEAQLLALRDEAVALAARIRERLEDVHAAEARALHLDAAVAAVEALDGAGATVVEGDVVCLPRGAPGARALGRSLRRTGADVHRASGRRTRVFVVRGGDPARVVPVAEAHGARPVAWPDVAGGVAPKAAAEALEAERAVAERVEAEARAKLRARVAEEGHRGRVLLDSLEDAERRRHARRLMASTQQVVALRIYVRREDDADLRAHLARTWGDAVAVRPLSEARDAPTLPRSVAPVPLAALRGLAPRRFGELPIPSVLALFTPVAAAAVLADMGGGLLLLLVGALLGIGSGRGSPRRDASLLAQAAGVTALTFGLLAGRAFGALGAQLFGTEWGLAPGVSFAGDGLEGVLVGVGQLLGQVAGAIAVFGVLLAVHRLASGRVARGRATLVGALDFACVAGLAFAAAPASSLAFLWWAAPVAIVARLVLTGPSRLVAGLLLDLVGVLRLVAVAGAAVLLFAHGFARLDAGGLPDLFVGPVALLVGAFALVVDPAHMAMGVPYDLSLGGRRFARPFTPFERRTRPEDA